MCGGKTGKTGLGREDLGRGKEQEADGSFWAGNDVSRQSWHRGKCEGRDDPGILTAGKGSRTQSSHQKGVGKGEKKGKKKEFSVRLWDVLCPWLYGMVGTLGCWILKLCPLYLAEKSSGAALPGTTIPDF